jgi:hypothetical protein
MALVGFYVGTSASRARATMTKIQDSSIEDHRGHVAS